MRKEHRGAIKSVRETSKQGAHPAAFNRTRSTEAWLRPRSLGPYPPARTTSPGRIMEVGYLKLFRRANVEVVKVFAIAGSRPEP